MKQKKGCFKDLGNNDITCLCPSCSIVSGENQSPVVNETAVQNTPEDKASTCDEIDSKSSGNQSLSNKIDRFGKVWEEDIKTAVKKLKKMNVDWAIDGMPVNFNDTVDEIFGEKLT